MDELEISTAAVATATARLRRVQRQAAVINGVLLVLFALASFLAWKVSATLG